MAGARLRRNKQLVSQLRESRTKDRHEISFRFLDPTLRYRGSRKQPWHFGKAAALITSKT